MIVVADASPFIVLVNIGRVEILPALFASVTIPTEVAAELALPHPLQRVNDFIKDPPPWLIIRAPQKQLAFPDLHAGESAAISLAQELRADLLLIDEQAGRKVATQHQIPIIGTIGVVILAAERGIVPIDQVFTEIRHTDFRVSDEFLDEQLRRFHARQGKS